MHVTRQCAQLKLTDVLSMPVWSLKRWHANDMHPLHILLLVHVCLVLTVLCMRVMPCGVVHSTCILRRCLVRCRVETAGR
jgi:hypothetical protein